MIMAPFWLLIELIISLLPNSPGVVLNIGALLKYVSYGMYILGSQFFLTVIGMIVFWLSAQFIWAVIEWIYIKIPGVS